MINYTYNDQSSRASFVEPGDYVATIVGFTFGISGQGNDKIDFELLLPDCKIYDSVAFTEKAAWKFDTMLKCFTPNKEGGAIPAKGTAVAIDEEFINKNLVGASGWVTTFIDVFNDTKRSKVSVYIDAAKKKLTGTAVEQVDRAEELDVEGNTPF
jgi:hypothetical protein